jgi:hypothetical protein
MTGPDPMEQYLSELRVGNEQARGVIYRSTSTDNRHRRENAPMLSSLSRATAGPASLTYLTLGPPRVLSGYVDVVVAQTIGGRPARSRPTRWLTRLYRRLSLSPLIGHNDASRHANRSPSAATTTAPSRPPAGHSPNPARHHDLDHPQRTHLHHWTHVLPRLTTGRSRSPRAGAAQLLHGRIHGDEVNTQAAGCVLPDLHGSARTVVTSR